MFWRTSSILVLWTLYSTISVNGYQIHKSCANAGIYKEVEDALKQAFAYAHAGIDALEQGHTMTDNKDWDGDLDPARPKELEDLIKLVFAHDDIINDKTPPVSESTEWSYHKNMKNLRLNKVYKVLESIIKWIEEPGAVEEPSTMDVVIYCDGNHLEYSSNKLYVLDKERNNIRLGTRFSATYQCSKDRGSALAVTWGSPQGNPRIKENFAKYSASMQICKGTVENIKSGAFTYYGSSKTYNPIAKWIAHRDQSREKKYNFRHIDSINQLDLLLLHELTHTRANMMDDVKIRSVWGIPRTAYRWDKIKVLAKSYPYVDTGAKTAADNNADSIAYFGLGCYLMSTEDKEGAYAIQDDGKLKRLDKPVVFNK